MRIYTDKEGQPDGFLKLKPKMINMVNENICDWPQSDRKCLLITMSLMYVIKLLYSVLIIKILAHPLVL